MDFVKPEYERRVVDWAGSTLRGPRELFKFYDPNGIDPEIVINNWRSSHAYVLNTFQMALRHRAVKVDEGAIVAQRSKRRTSIKAKLERMDSLRLSEMQDIAGCRAIVSSVKQVTNWSRVTSVDTQSTNLLMKMTTSSIPNQMATEVIISYTATTIRNFLHMKG